MPSESELLRAVQAAGASDATCDAFAAQFLPFIRYLAGRYCALYKLDFTLIDDVVQSTVLMVLDPEIARFDPSCGESHLSYLRGLVQNSAKANARFIHRGQAVRHDYRHPLNAELGLPQSVEEVPDGADDLAGVEYDDQVQRVMELANGDERQIVLRHFFRDETIAAIAASMGVARTTVSRRLERFFHRVAILLAA